MLGKSKKKTRQIDFQIYVIYDSKTDSYHKVPSFAVNEADLIRQITTMFADPSQAANKFYANAEDFAVFKVGNYCFKTGTIESQPHEHVINLHEIRSGVENSRKQNLNQTLTQPAVDAALQDSANH